MRYSSVAIVSLVLVWVGGCAVESPEGAGPAVEFPQGPGPEPAGRYRSTDLWREPSGYYLDRMLLQDREGNFPLYRSQWTENGGSHQLVCLQYPGQELFGTPYRVFVYDRNLTLLRRGRLTAPQDDEPLAIVEVKATGKRIPPTRRDQWQLAIVLEDRETSWDPAKPVRLIGFDEPDDRANYVRCEIVTWEGDSDMSGGVGSLNEVDSIEFRTAERNWRVRGDGTVQVLSKDLGTNAP